MSSSLRELQLWLKWIISDPRGVEVALREPAPQDAEPRDRYQEPSPSYLHGIGDAPPLRRAERLEIYAEAYFSRLLESLSSDFPAVIAVTGQEDFARMAAQYLKHFPSRTPNIGEVGRHLAHFLETYPPALEAPYLADLARLEWLTIESFYSESVAPLDPARLSDISPEAWETASFVVDPSLRLMRSSWPVHQIREAQSAIGVLERESYLFIHRPHFEVHVVEIKDAQLSALAALALGKTLPEVCEALPEDSDVTILFGEWVRLGLIRDVITKKEG